MTELRLEPVASFAEARADWERLAAASGNVFATPEWAEIWWRHHGGGRPLLLRRALEAGGEVRAMLPLYLWQRRPLRVARFLGHGPGDELGPVAATGADRLDALHAAAAQLGVDAIVADVLPGRLGWPGRVVVRDASPVLRLAGAGSWAEVGRGWSSNLRQRVRRELRRAESAGCTVREGGRDRLEADLDVLFRLHRARWRGTASPFAADEPFHREFARLAAERGWLRLRLLERDGVALAAWYGLRFGGADGYYQSGRDPSVAEFSPGFALLLRTIEEAHADGMSEYRFLRGDEPYKFRFATGDAGLATVVLGCSAAGRALEAGTVAAPLLRRSRRLARELARSARARRAGSGGRRSS